MGDDQRELGYTDFDLSQFAGEQEKQVKKVLKLPLRDCPDANGILNIIIKMT